MGKVVGDKGYGEEQQCEHNHPHVGFKASPNNEENPHDKENEREQKVNVVHVSHSPFLKAVEYSFSEGQGFRKLLLEG